MTPTERAEKIVLASRQNRFAKAVAFKEFIVTQIAEAEREVKDEAQRAWINADPNHRNHIQKVSFDRGFTAAREKALKIVEAHKHVEPFDWDKSLQDKLAIYSNNTCSMIAESIRMMGIDK